MKAAILQINACRQAKLFIPEQLTAAHRIFIQPPKSQHRGIKLRRHGGLDFHFDRLKITGTHQKPPPCRRARFKVNEICRAQSANESIRHSP